MTDDVRLPGEDGPLPMRFGGAPITDQEALGVARRLARLTDRPVPDALPTGGDRLTPVGYRMHGALLARVRARAEMEGSTVTAAITEALEAFAAASPGSQVAYLMPPPPAPDADPPPAPEADPTPDPEPVPDPRFATAEQLAARLGVPRARALSWVRTARERGVELEGPRSERPRSRTPVYDVEQVAAFGATLRRGRPRREPTTPLVARTGPRRQRPRHQQPPAAE